MYSLYISGRSRAPSGAAAAGNQRFGIDLIHKVFYLLGITVSKVIFAEKGDIVKSGFSMIFRILLRAGSYRPMGMPPAWRQTAPVPGRLNNSVMPGQVF